MEILPLNGLESGHDQEVLGEEDLDVFTLTLGAIIGKVDPKAAAPVQILNLIGLELSVSLESALLFDGLWGHEFNFKQSDLFFSVHRDQE